MEAVVAAPINYGYRFPAALGRRLPPLGHHVAVGNDAHRAGEGRGVRPHPTWCAQDRADERSLRELPVHLRRPELALEKARENGIRDVKIQLLSTGTSSTTRPSRPCIPTASPAGIWSTPASWRRRSCCCSTPTSSTWARPTTRCTRGCRPSCRTTTCCHRARLHAAVGLPVLARGILAREGGDPAQRRVKHMVEAVKHEFSGEGDYHEV